MKLTQKIFAQSKREHQQSKGVILDFKMKHLTSISNLNQFLPASKVIEIDLTENYIKYIEPIISECSELVKLNLPLNHVRVIENLEGCSKILYLNLATNRIQYIGNLERLRGLIYLDLSMNYIEKLENLALPNLECLKINGNEIKYIENLSECPRLKQLEISKNKLQSLGQLGLPPQFKELQILKVMYNEMALEYIDDLCLSLQNLPSLNELDCTGNEVTLHRFYKYKLITTNKLLVIDQVDVKPYLKEHIKKLKNDEDFQELMEGTENEYFERMKEEQKVKNSLKDMIRRQEKQVEGMYEEYQKEMGNDLNDFIEFMQFYQNKKRQGQEVDIQSKELQKWRSKLLVAEKERQRLIELAQSKQKEVEKNYLESKVATTKLADKLYEISMKEPDVWRDLKARELAQQIKEEDEMKGNSNYYNNQEELGDDPWNFPSQQKQFQNSLNKGLRDMQGSQLQMEKEMAIKSIQQKIKPLKENPREKNINFRDKEMGSQFDPFVQMDQQEQLRSGGSQNQNKIEGKQTGKKKKKKGKKQESSVDGSRPETGEIDKQSGDSSANNREVMNESQLQQKVLAQRSELMRMEQIYQQEQQNKNKKKGMLVNPDFVQERINHLIEQEEINKKQPNGRLGNNNCGNQKQLNEKKEIKVNEPNGKTAACLIF